MAHKLPVPEIPQVPDRRAGRAAVGSRLVPAQTAPPTRSHQPELPDFLEAFWGDGASAGEASDTGRTRKRRRSVGRSASG
jgi:hypothetical protein